ERHEDLRLDIHQHDPLAHTDRPGPRTFARRNLSSPHAISTRDRVAPILKSGPIPTWADESLPQETNLAAARLSAAHHAAGDHSPDRACVGRRIGHPDAHVRPG